MKRYPIYIDLFKSDNINNGGVGRVDRKRVADCMGEANFVATCKAMGFIVWLIGTDYVVAASGVRFEKLAA